LHRTALTARLARASLPVRRFRDVPPRFEAPARRQDRAVQEHAPSCDTVLKAFATSAGPGALADFMAEGFDRHLILARVRLARQLNPIATGAHELLI
jgi:hypothetical protein